MASVTLKNVKKIYPHTEKKKKKKDEPEKKNNLQITEEGVVAVQEFNLEIQDREFVVLVGPSGCGKSTTLRMIAGLEEITDGELYIGDRLVNDVAPKDRDIAMVFQSYALYPHMTVYENMAFSLKLKKVPKAEIDRKVREAAEILGITEYLDRKPKALSGGQRQRVAIGRAIVRNPQVLLMDEPLSNLDAKLRNQMRAELIKLRSRIDTTFVYVTHDQTEAMALSDRIIVMNKGVIEQMGTPEEIYFRPASKFVADFIGRSNFANGKIVAQDGNSVKVELLGQTIEVQDDVQFQTAVDEEVCCMTRPESMLIGKEGLFKGKVQTSTFMGSMQEYFVDVQGTVFIIEDYNFRQNGVFAEGEEVFLSYKPGTLHLIKA